MANRFLSTKGMVLNIDRVSAIWFDYDDDGNITALNVSGDNLSWEVAVDDPDFSAIKKWVEDCAAGKIQRNEKGIFICSHCGAPNTEAG